MEKQVDKKAYDFKKYCQPERWASYWHQIDEVLKVNPQSVLEIGVGDKVLANYLKDNTNISYTSADIAEDLHPDVITDIESLSFEDNSFDVACAFEVLEHLPFAKFSQALGELKRVTRNYVIISVPHWGRHFSFDIRMPFLKRLKGQFKFSLKPLKHEFNGQHYWEIGKKDFPVEKIRKEIKKTGLVIVRDYVAFESPYHHFFVLRK